MSIYVTNPPVLVNDTNGFFATVFPIPVIFARAPLATDINFTVGQVWIDNAVALPVIYMLSSLAGDVAQWLQISN